MWQYFFVSIVMSAISYLLTPKPKTPQVKPGSFEDIPTAQDGASISRIFGTVKIRGASVVWYGDVRTRAIKSKGGKK